MATSITITDTQMFDWVFNPDPTAQLKDKAGNAAVNADGTPQLVGIITLTSEDTTKVTVGPQEAGGVPTGVVNAFTIKAVKAPGDLGAVQVTAVNDSSTPIVDAVNVTVNAQGATSLGGSVGTAVEQP